ncbi:MAG: hypothetical protein JSW41_03880 [Candidatus Aenigmatarchaeota archaeon]|nr:MAG: hypothetical protein JSW41_03880 [Candidatus Aenigmarchaeota archaeon]
MPYLYNSVEEIPYEYLQKGGKFHVRTQNCHYDLRKRTKGVVAVLTSDELHSQGGNLDIQSLAMEGGPTPSGPFTPLIILALKFLLISTCIIVVSAVVGTVVLSIISDPVDVIGYDKTGRPTLLSRRKSGDVLTIGYDKEGSAYISDESEGGGLIPGLDLNLILWVVVALAILFVIVLILFRSPIGERIGTKPKGETSPEEKGKRKEG